LIKSLTAGDKAYRSSIDKFLKTFLKIESIFQKNNEYPHYISQGWWGDPANPYYVDIFHFELTGSGNFDFELNKKSFKWIPKILEELDASLKTILDRQSIKAVIKIISERPLKRKGALKEYEGLTILDLFRAVVKPYFEEFWAFFVHSTEFPPGLAKIYEVIVAVESEEKKQPKKMDKQLQTTLHIQKLGETKDDNVSHIDIDYILNLKKQHFELPEKSKINQISKKTKEEIEKVIYHIKKIKQTDPEFYKDFLFDKFASLRVINQNKNVLALEVLVLLNNYKGKPLEYFIGVKACQNCIYGAPCKIKEVIEQFLKYYKYDEEVKNKRIKTKNARNKGIEFVNLYFKEAYEKIEAPNNICAYYSFDEDAFNKAIDKFYEIGGPLEEERKRRAEERRKIEIEQDRIKREEEERRLEEERKEVKLRKSVEIIKQMMKVSTRIKLETMRKILEMDEKFFLENVFDWAIQFGFEIKDDVIIIKKEPVDDFYNMLDAQFGEWEEKEKGKEGKI